VAIGSGLAFTNAQLSFVSAMSVERAEPAGPATVCVAGQPHEVAWDRPLEVPDVDGPLVLENCGRVPVTVDWIEPLGP
jgi:hypothetical protein